MNKIDLKVPSKIVTDDILNYYYEFSAKIWPDISCELYARQMIHMAYQALFSLKNKKKNNIKMQQKG